MYAAMDRGNPSEGSEITKATATAQTSIGYVLVSGGAHSGKLLNTDSLRQSDKICSPIPSFSSDERAHLANRLVYFLKVYFKVVEDM